MPSRFDAGFQSFYGLMSIRVESGNVRVMGANLERGRRYEFHIPIYGLPLSFESETPFTLTIEPLPENSITPAEERYYFPEKIPDGFSQIGPGIYTSKIVHGANYPKKSIDNLVNSASKNHKYYVTGNKGAGKSTFSMYFINSLLSNNGGNGVALLDVDPGQPLLSLPGSLSLSIIHDYLINPPEFLSKEAQQITFYGGANLSDDPDGFINCVKYLIPKIPSNMPVIINTFGWVEDLGLEIHRQILDLIKPQYVISLHPSDEDPAPLRESMYNIIVDPRPGPMKISPREQREIRIFTYFRRGKGKLPMQQPISIPIQSVRLGFVMPMPPQESLVALNGAFVALCWDERQFRAPTKKVAILPSLEPMKCAGFAIVRAIDRRNNLFYLLTETPIEEFNTIVMGRVMTPGLVYNETPRSDAAYLGIDVMNKEGSSSSPMNLKYKPVYQS